MARHNLFMTIIFIACWISLLDFPAPMFVDVDTSWQQFFGYAFKQKLQAGVDYLFTYGPLSYFFLKNPPYDSELFWITVGGKILIYAWLSLIFLMSMIQNTSQKKRWFYMLVIVILLPLFADVSDSLYFFAIVGTTFLMMNRSSSSKGYPLFIFFGLLSLVLISLTKFTFFILVVLCIVGLLIRMWLDEAFKQAFFLGSGFIALFLGIWSLCQPSVWNVLSYLSTAWKISRDYSETMSLPVEPALLWLVLSIMVVSVLMIGLNYFRRPWTLTSWINGGILLCTLFLTWKAGFVRYAPYAHASIFFVFVLLLPLLLQASFKSKTNNFLEGFNFLLILGGLSWTVGSYYNYTLSALPEVWYTKIAYNLSVLYSLEETQAHYDQNLFSLHSDYALPKVQKQVGQASVDIFSKDVGIMFFNRLNYHPRPFFQGYAAYNKDFLQMNGHFYANPHTAPSFILFKHTPLDIRFPTMEDSQALRIILRDYQPIDYENDLWLLARRPRSSSRRILLTQAVPLEENINLRNFSHQVLSVSLEFKKSFWGKLMTFFFQLPPLYLEIETTEGVSFACRLIPSLSQSEFVINPLLVEPLDWFKWYLGLPLRKVSKIKVRTLSRQYLFQPLIKVTLSEEEGLTPYLVEGELKHILLKNIQKK